MDPAGIREICLVRPYLNNPYQFERIGEALPFKTRVHGIYSNIPWLPLSEPLTQRVSIASEGYPGWLQHDCLILAGVDLESASERDIQHLRSAAERGLPLFVCGGYFGLGSSARLWRDLEGALPAHIPAAEPVKIPGRVVACGEHPILRGLPGSFGTVKAVHPVEPHDDARVLLSVDGHPVLVVSERFGSRQLILAVAEADGLCCDALDDQGFYGHPFYPDLIRRCLTWLMDVQVPLSFVSLRLDNRPDESSGQVLRTVVRQEGRVAGAALRCSVFAIDEAGVASGGDTQRAETLHEETRPIRTAEQSESFTISDALAGKCSGVYEVEVALEMDEPPLTPPKQCFGMASPPQWNNWKGEAVELRRFYVRFPDRRAARVFVPGRTFTLEEGKPWKIRVSAPDLAASQLVVHDDKGVVLGKLTARSPQAHELRWPVPTLVEGDYTATLSVERGAGIAEEFRFALKAVAPRPADESFPMVSHSGTAEQSDEEVRRLFRANLEEFGLDTLSLGLARYGEKFWDESLDWSAEPFAVRRGRWVDALAAAEGRHLWNDFDTSMIVLATHGATKEYDPTVPCVHHPDYEAAARRKLEPRLRLLAERAALISTEIIDEPHLYPSNICRCELCLRLYRERFGEDMPSWEEVTGDQTARRWHLFQWLEDYTTRAFAVTQKIKKEIAPELHLHNVAIDRLFVSNFMFNGIHRWAAFGDEIYMACYPWSYLNWRGYRQMPHSQTHWIASWIRGLARHNGIPWGVFMELWEHDVPNRWLPPYWSVCQFYSLLAEGADRLDTFLVCFGVEVFGISWERLREFGREVNKIRPFFPLLPRTRRPKARMAFVNPWAEWVMNPQPHCLPPGHEGYGYYRRYGAPFDKLYPHENRHLLAYELFHRVFGDLDQMDEQLICEAPMDYQAIVVSDCAFLMARTMEKLRAFVEAGGVLILDCVPERNEVGERTEFFSSLTRGTPLRSGVIVPGLSYRIFAVGKGKALCFSASVQTSYADAVENERAGVRARLESAVGALLGELRLDSRCLSTNGDVDAGLRLGDGVCLVPVANTSGRGQTATIPVRELPFRPTFAVDLTSGSFVAFRQSRGGVEFDVALESYHGALYAFFPSRPESLKLTLATAEMRDGENLTADIVLLDKDGKSAPGAFLVNAAVTDGEGRVHPRLGGPLIVQNGSLRLERRLPVNAQPGTWQIALEEPILGLTAWAEFAVRA